jgi:group I intron endonuclease
MLPSGIYNIINSVNGRRYIGSSKNPIGRWYKHLYKLRKNIHENCHLQKSYNKYGEKCFRFEIVELCSVSTLLKQEQFYLDKAEKNKNEYYNLNFTANKPPSPKGKKRSVVTKNKMSVLMTGPNNHRFGKQATKNTKEKMAASHSKVNYLFVSPDNKIVTIRNLKRFCRDNKLNEGGMFGVYHMRYKQYKGWKKSFCN